VKSGLDKGDLKMKNEKLPSDSTQSTVEFFQPKLNIEQTAIICHEANRAYCRTIGDSSQPDWAHAEEWQRLSSIKGVMFYLGALSEGRELDPSAAHTNWLSDKTKDGWSYGPVKDAVKKQHPCFVSYGDLPFEQRLKDYIFIGIVEAIWTGIACEGGNIEDLFKEK
jgi:RyR domain